MLFGINSLAGAISSPLSIWGWVQGHSEFGPRALGNRSILADPRLLENRDRVNHLVKKREGYRPFAPAVLVEDAHEYFKLPSNKSHFPFMNYVVEVREDKRHLIKAVTHVDGTARIQTVSRQTNERFWDLIHAFKVLTEIPIVLNTHSIITLSRLLIHYLTRSHVF